MEQAPDVQYFTRELSPLGEGLLYSWSYSETTPNGEYSLIWPFTAMKMRPIALKMAKVDSSSFQILFYPWADTTIHLLLGKEASHVPSN